MKWLLILLALSHSAEAEECDPFHFEPVMVGPSASKAVLPPFRILLDKGWNDRLESDAPLYKRTNSSQGGASQTLSWVINAKDYGYYDASADSSFATQTALSEIHGFLTRIADPGTVPASVARQARIFDGLTLSDFLDFGMMKAEDGRVSLVMKAIEAAVGHEQADKIIARMGNPKLAKERAPTFLRRTILASTDPKFSANPARALFCAAAGYGKQGGSVEAQKSIAKVTSGLLLEHLAVQATQRLADSGPTQAAQTSVLTVALNLGPACELVDSRTLGIVLQPRKAGCQSVVQNRAVVRAGPKPGEAQFIQVGSWLYQASCRARDGASVNLSEQGTPAASDPLKMIELLKEMTRRDSAIKDPELAKLAANLNLGGDLNQSAQLLKKAVEICDRDLAAATQKPSARPREIVYPPGISKPPGADGGGDAR